MKSVITVHNLQGRRDLILSRPDVGNCLSEEMVTALSTELKQAADDEVKLVTLRGQGRHFCTGFDLSDLDTATDERLLARFIAIEMLLAQIWTAPFDTLALAQGQTMGAGADLFVACRRRFAAADTQFAFPGAAFGLVLGSRRLGCRIGDENAADLIRSGKRIDAAKAEELGLVHGLIESEDAVFTRETSRALRLDYTTVLQVQQALAGASEQEKIDRDLAMLVRSAARPGLGARIQAYRKAVMAARTCNKKASTQ